MPDPEVERLPLPVEILQKTDFIIRLAKELQNTSKAGSAPLILFLMNLSSPPSPHQLATIREVVSVLTEQKGVVGLSEFADLGVIVTQTPAANALAEAELILNALSSVSDTRDLRVDIGLSICQKSDGPTPAKLLERARDGLKLVAENGGSKVGLVLSPGQNAPPIDQNDPQIILQHQRPARKKVF